MKTSKNKTKLNTSLALVLLVKSVFTVALNLVHEKERALVIKVSSQFTKFGYSLDLKTTFNFSLCSTYSSEDDNLGNSDVDVSDEINSTSQIISFNLVIKPVTGSALPSKWVEIEVSSLNDILADIHYHIIKLTGDEEIVHPDYMVTFKSEKSVGMGA
ncbi:hypothetical protein C1646_758212 [Rhizophagus diaphanus]|nr:hypothetical protein C1646_758212 [Rhizophagus diaphanus] [Rhizophagus sp. MUCL 43196]